jgi:N-acetylmuramic acid 6-phosphate etherase
MMKRITEQDSLHRGLENMSTRDLLININKEDRSVPISVSNAIPEIETLIEAVYEKLSKGGRLFYIGSGTSGRLGIVDASECPPTFGVPHELVTGIIAGGDRAIRKAVEFAEDDTESAWKDLKDENITNKDFVIGISASGTTPYVVGGLLLCRKYGVETGSITCNPGSPLTSKADYPVCVVTGPEFVTGSTRMKAGTAQKLVLNMITTSVMIKLGRILDNKMVDMQLTNTKLQERAVKMICHFLNIEEDAAKLLLDKHGTVRKALDSQIN